MSSATLKNLVLYAALAFSPALLSAQGMPANTAAPPSTSDQATKPAGDQATKSTDTQSDAMAYKRELDACDKAPSTDRDTCRNAVDQKYGKKSSNTSPPIAK